jgi:hypothetical protein
MFGDVFEEGLLPFRYIFRISDFHQCLVTGFKDILEIFHVAKGIEYFGASKISPPGEGVFYFESNSAQTKIYPCFPGAQAVPYRVIDTAASFSFVDQSPVIYWNTCLDFGQ